MRRPVATLATLAAFATLTFAALLAPLAVADGLRTVDHTRLRVGDLFPTVDASVAQVELGAAPPPGQTRLVGRSEVEIALRREGFDPGPLKLPPSIRVQTTAKHLRPAELAEQARPAIEAALPRGVAFVKTQSMLVDVVVPPRAAIGKAVVPKPPRQKGPFRTTVMVEVVSDGDVFLRIPFATTLDVDEEAARPDVPRNGRITVSIDEGAVRVTAHAIAMNEGNVGDTISAQVIGTSKIVRAKLISSAEARVVERP